MAHAKNADTHARKRYRLVPDYFALSTLILIASDTHFETGSEKQFKKIIEFDSL